MRETVEEDRISSSPARVGMVEEKVFSMFEAVRGNRDYIAMRSISAIDCVTRIDARLDALRRLNENFKMSVLPDGGLKWMVLAGREKMGSEMAALSPLCQELHEKLLALMERTCAREGFTRAAIAARQEHKKLASGAFRKRFDRDIWTPDGDKIASYIEDDDWFRGFAEGLSRVVLELLASAALLKVSYLEELDVILASSAQKIAWMEMSGVPVPEDFSAHMQPASQDRQRKIFLNLALHSSESILERYLAENARFVAFADAVSEMRNELEAMVRRAILYHELVGLGLDFPHPELDLFVGYQSSRDSEDEGSYIVRYMTSRRTQLDAQKRYYLMKLWRLAPQQLERIRQNVAAEWEAFCRSEGEVLTGMAETLRMLKGDGRKHQAALRSLGAFDAENDARIEGLPGELKAGADDDELAGTLAALKKCSQVRTGEFMGLAAMLREDVARAMQLVEAGSFPQQARQKFIGAAGQFNDIVPAPGRGAVDELYMSAVDYYGNILASRDGLGGLCLQSVKNDLAARCRELEEQDRRFAGLLPGVLLTFGIPDQFGGQGLAWLVTMYEEAQEHIYKEAERFIVGFRDALLEGSRGRIERAQRTIVLDWMKTRLEAIACFVPRRPSQPAADVAALEKMRKELFGQDLLVDAQQYWLKVREHCEAISASIRIHLDFSMITEEDRKAGWETVLDRLDVRFIAIIVTLDERLKELDSVLGRIPELSDLRLGGKPGPDLKTCAGDERRFPALRIGHLEDVYRAIHSARQRAIRQFGDILKLARELHLPSKQVSGLEALTGSDIDAGLVGFAAWRSSLREWLRATVEASSAKLDIPRGGRWEMPDGATTASWLEAFREFLVQFTQKARAAIEEAAALGESMAASEELGNIKRKAIGGCRMKDILETSDVTEMREMAYLLFRGEQEIESARRDIELAQSRSDLQGVLDGCRRWRALRRRLEDIAVSRRDSWKATLLDALRDIEDRRLREYNLSRNKAAFQDRALIEDIQRAVVRCKLRGKNLTTREFQRLMRTLHKSGQVQLTDRSDAMFMTPGQYPEYGLSVAPSETEPDTVCKAEAGELVLEFVYQPKKMLLVLKGR